MHELRERLGNLSLAVNRVCYQLPNIVRPERSNHDFLHAPASLADRFQRPNQRMRRIDFIVPIGANQHQVLHLRLGNQVPDQSKGRSIHPLKIVEEQGERVFGSSEHTDEPPKHQLKALFPVLRRELGDRWLLPDDQNKLGDQVCHKLAVRAKCLEQRIPPAVQLRIILAEQMTYETLQCLRECRIRNVPLVLVKLASRKDAPWGDHFVQLVDER
jgi:hypothetical protein